MTRHDRDALAQLILSEISRHGRGSTSALARKIARAVESAGYQPPPVIPIIPRGVVFVAGETLGELKNYEG